MVGCGNSALSEELHRVGYSVTSIDISGAAIEKMRQSYVAEEGMAWRLGTI